ncbi:dynamin family protein [Hirsutella rhossiliensis]|uniref:Dynamin family domain-containing protein n=1 Tax=Hirsutella rhossiliensis TaxID=111463 RepID=A0A9P8SMI4_9HYPO|nr:dynamin family domain-containing protein [Hirsutella rhossiliensis]KAH0968041.1 dynamin family domain-containing protein [Hirsutella rhossiliensis]
MDVSLSPTVLGQLNTAEARALHEVTDRLSSCGVGRIVNLPQIIVVGEQSAGKSSVLEAISHVRFPVQGGLCTRFATELVLRQAKETRVDVSVKFADRSRPSKTFQRAGFNQADLPDIIQEAKESMGLAGTGRDFSKDVLRLEIEGPSMYPLTLVDLPGLFQVDTADQSMRGKETVDQLVESYMSQKNSIILVVITASNQLANHIALRKVKEHDPQRERTIGVINKPDLTRPGYMDERTYIQLARNQESANKLKLGWHVLRNRAEDEPSLDCRDANEDNFFQNSAWASIPREDRGVVSLRRKLSRVLYDHIRNNLHGVVQDIEGKLRERQEELDRLGNSRSSQEDMRSFLLTITGEFQRLARDGIHGRYNDPFFGDLDDQDHKLRAQLRNFNRVFDHVLTTKGSNKQIGRAVDDSQVPDYLETFMERYPYNFPNPETITLEDMSAQLQQQAASNQGREFPGSPNQELVIQLFQKQASPWRSIAEFHINTVTLAAKAFVDQLFRHVIGHPDTSRTTEAILSTCVDPFFSDKENALRGKLEELLRPYTQGYALPLDAVFHRTMSQRSTSRLADHLVEAFREEHPDMFEDQKSRKKLTRTLISEVVSNADDIDGGEFGSDKVIDMMEAYYEMSRRTFTDNIINLAIESCLVCDIPDILTPTKVDRMSSERLRELAAESEDAQSRRRHLQDEIDVLRQGLEQCRRYKPRAVTDPSVATLPTPASTSASNSTATSSSQASPRPLFSQKLFGPGADGPKSSPASLPKWKPFVFTPFTPKPANDSEHSSTSSGTQATSNNHNGNLFGSRYSPVPVSKGSQNGLGKTQGDSGRSVVEPVHPISLFSPR